MKKALILAALLALALLGPLVSPLAAAPWCTSFCDCDVPCFQQCYDEHGSNVCYNYVCQGSCLAQAADHTEPWLTAVTASAGTMSGGAPITPAWNCSSAVPSTGK